MSDYLRRGTPAYRRASIGLFCAGFSSFALLYCMQPLLPLLARAFAVGPASSSLAVSSATVGVAVSLLIVGAVSDRLGRKALMGASLFGVVAFTLAAAAAPTWPALLALRFMSGVALSGVPAVAMAYLAEEVEPEALGAAMGLYIGGNAIGGMAGRLFTGAMADITGSWRLAVAGMGLLGLIAAIAFVRVLPPSRRFEPAPQSRAGAYARELLALLAEPGLIWLLAVGFLLMGAFVALFNNISFRLVAAPFGLSNAAVGAIFLVYLIGAPVSAMFGRLGDRFGRARIMALGASLILAGLLATLSSCLAVIILGLAMVTGGYFGTHALAGASVTSRAPQARGKASALYLLAVYLGPSAAGAMAGRLYSDHGWRAMIGLLAAMVATPIVILIASPLRRR